METVLCVLTKESLQVPGLSKSRLILRTNQKTVCPGYVWLMGEERHTIGTAAWTGPVRSGMESELYARSSEKPWKGLNERNDTTWSFVFVFTRSIAVWRMDWKGAKQLESHRIPTKKWWCLASEMVPWVKAMTVLVWDVRPIPGAHTSTEGENWLLQVVLWSLQALLGNDSSPSSGT